MTAAPDAEGHGEAAGAPEGAIVRELEIRNKLGLHSRPAAKFAATVEDFDAVVLVSARGGEQIDGSSILDLLMLGAGPGCCITVAATGPEAAQVMEALTALIDGRFGEGD